LCRLPANAVVEATTDSIPVAAYRFADEETYAIQFHPEVVHSEHGTQLLRNFIYEIAGCAPTWTPASFIDETVESLKKQIGGGKVVLGLSGGVDSTVAAVLLDKAIGDRLHCIFVNNGLLRKNEFEGVLAQYEHLGLNVVGVDASAEILRGPRRPRGSRGEAQGHWPHLYRWFLTAKPTVFKGLNSSDKARFTPTSLSR